MNKRAQNLFDINMVAVKKQLAKAPFEFDEESGEDVRRVWLGTVFGLTPSGKFYTPFACSNVSGDCPVCQGKGHMTPKTGNKIRKRAEARSKDFARKTLKRTGDARQRYAEAVKELRIKAFNASRDECPCCYGSGSLSATKDELWNEALEHAAESIDAYVDFHDSDIFIAQRKQEAEIDM